jgi:phospholipase C
MRITVAGVALLALAGCSSSSETAANDAGSVGDGALDATVDGADAAADGSAPTCPSAPYDDSLRTERTACSFDAGARASDTLGLTDAGRAAIPITHIVVVMKENRSFDHYFGQLSKNGQADVEA